LQETTKAGKERNTKDVSEEKEETMKQKGQKTIRWGDMDSDDEDTVILQNLRNMDKEGERWEIVKNKKTEKLNKEKDQDEGKRIWVTGTQSRIHISKRLVKPRTY